VIGGRVIGCTRQSPAVALTAHSQVSMSGRSEVALLLVVQF